MAERRVEERRKATRRRGGDRRGRAVHVATDASFRKLIEDWEVACNTRQVDQVAGLYTTDAVVLPPSGMPVSGAEPIRQFFAALIKAGLGEVVLEPTRVEAAGNLAYAYGRYQMLVPVGPALRKEERGNFAVICRCQPGGDWKVVLDIKCSDSAKSKQAAHHCA